MSGNFTYHNREAHRSTVYVLLEETFLLPLNDVDIMRQTGTSIDKASEHKLNDDWNKASEVALSEELIEMTRYQSF